MRLLRLMKDAERLNKKYGGLFGYKVIIITTIVSIIFVILALTILQIVKYQESNQEFILDSERKYIIHRVMPESNLYYEVDFNIGEATKRTDSNGMKREKLAEYENGLNELEIFIEDIVSEKGNLTVSDEDRNELIKKNNYQIYELSDYKGNKYYIKNSEQIEKYKQLLDNLE